MDYCGNDLNRFAVAAAVVVVVVVIVVVVGDGSFVVAVAVLAITSSMLKFFQNDFPPYSCLDWQFAASAVASAVAVKK